MLNPNENALIEFVQEFAPQLPAQRRIRVYRGAADSIEDRKCRNAFNSQAIILEEAERRCAELNFNFTGSNQNHYGKDGAA